MSRICQNVILQTSFVLHHEQLVSILKVIVNDDYV